MTDSKLTESMDCENVDLSPISYSATHKSSSWAITSGCVEDAVTYESSIWAVDSDLTTHKAPLVLRRPTPDSGPCEITICFTQKHEIKQVYVRSTARVYEIYYSANDKADNEYLCTVRCSLAAKNEHALLPEMDADVDADGFLSTTSSRPNVGSSEGTGHLRSDSGASTNEDDWVDVKLQSPSMLDARGKCLSNKHETFVERGNQDYFEATAEVSDAEPILSITLRLLSIQSGDHIYIDEVYVFADPVESTDTYSSTNVPETSSQTATMSLLIPTLLNMSNFRRKQSDHAVDERKYQDTGLKSISEPVASHTSQSETIQGTVLKGASGHMSKPDFPVQNLDHQNNSYSDSEKNDFSSIRIEKILDELVSRVAKIEDFCLRFEEKMVKPITNMEARLGRVEQQLESFAKNTVSMTACTRISAPEFSCSESESNPIFNGGNDSPATTNSESIKKDESRLQDLSIPPLDAYSPLSIQCNKVSSPTTDAAQLIPSLVVTAPDFSSVDDEGENDSFEAEKDFLKGSLKKPLSINDALASALAGFLSSASNKIDVVEETYDIKEEKGSSCPSELIPSDEPVSSVSIDGNNSSGKDDIVVTEQESFCARSGFGETSESVDGHNCIIEEGESEKYHRNSSSNLANLDQVQTDLYDLSIDRSREADDELNPTFVFSYSESPDNDNSVTALEAPATNMDHCSGEEREKECPDTLLNFLKLQTPAVVDFGIPILDVKFLSHDNFSKSSLNALLVDVPDECSEFTCVDVDNPTSFGEQSDLVTTENMESTTSETQNSQLFPLDNYDSGHMLSNREKEL